MNSDPTTGDPFPPVYILAAPPPTDHATLAMQMRRLQESEDVETSHSEADRLMVAELRRLGYTDAMDAYLTMRRWYA